MTRVDPSVAESLARAHKALFADLRELEKAIAPQSEKTVAEMRRLIAATSAHLTEQFLLEERNGYLETVRKKEPRLERAILQLAEEHGRLKQSLEMIVGQIGLAESLDEGLRETIRDWIKRVRQHEVHENGLVQDAFGVDIAAED